MREIWADYLVSKIRYDENYNYITNLFIHADKGDTVGVGETYPRQWVVNQILKGTSFNTIFLENDKYKNGAKVEIVDIDNKKYLKTNPNKTKKTIWENYLSFKHLMPITSTGCQWTSSIKMDME